MKFGSTAVFAMLHPILLQILQLHLQNKKRHTKGSCPYNILSLSSLYRHNLSGIDIPPVAIAYLTFDLKL